MERSERRDRLHIIADARYRPLIEPAPIAT